MHQPPLVEQAMGRQALALLRHLDAACASAEELEQAVIASFDQHPDAGIITSFPGLGSLTLTRRPAAPGHIWAFPALTASPGARAHYDRRKTAGDRHAAAQRSLFNLLLGCLTTSWPPGSTSTERM